MAPVHVHLHVRDLERSKTFYRTWFDLRDGLDEGDIQFVVGRGLELALALDPDTTPLPAWFHWGFKLDTADAVEALYRRLTEAGVTIVKPLVQDEAFALFRCADPDGHAVEIYWDA